MRPVIICVDDEKLILDSLKGQLQHKFNSECNLEIAESAEEALELLDELMEEEIEVPLVISDQIMPGMKGDELLVRINQISPRTNKILLTGQASAEAVGNALNNAKLYRYISKPWEEADLVLTAREAIKSFYKDKTITEQNEALKESVQELKKAKDELEVYNTKLESLVEERTRQVVDQKEEIEKKNDSILASINYANRIQKAMLPQDCSLTNFFPNAFIYFKPRDIVSGDFYWFGEVDGLFVIAAVDCTGHGVPGAILSMVGMREFNHIVLEKGILKPHLILEGLHKSIRTMLKQEEGDNRDGMDAAVCTIDPQNKCVYFAGAKNGLVYITNIGNQKELHYVRGDSKSIGGAQQEQIRKFKFHEIDLVGATNFYLFSDGFQDQFGGPSNRKFGRRNFHRLLKEISHKPLNEQQEQIRNSQATWQEKQKQIDDILVMGFLIE